jgi:2-polyprenyl-6-methoxyphenol hydroxylase-like FAD-dependent oxidoreductase
LGPGLREEAATLKCQVVVVGGGPVGLLLAAELGQRGIRTIVVERQAGLQTHPAANHHTARTMEHYRRLGLARSIRSAGLPPTFKPDVTFWNALGRYELARLEIPSSKEMPQAARFWENRWPTPELPHRCSQLFFEPILQSAAREQSVTTILNGWEVTEVDQSAQAIQVVARDKDEKYLRIKGDYVVGCDGPKSMVRECIQSRLTGTKTSRKFFGGQMVSLYFSCPTFYEHSGKPPAWHYWFVDKSFRALVVSVDGKSNFQMNVQIPEDASSVNLDARTLLRDALGVDLPFTMHSISPWIAGHALVADQYSNGRILIAGDAAHLFTPTGGLGFNTGVGDAANLAWKLEAVCKGWASLSLLASYQTERRAIAIRNTGFSKLTADRMAAIELPALVQEEGPTGEEARAEARNLLYQHATAEFMAPGCQLGERYTDSPIVFSDGDAPPDLFDRYEESASPGMRAPHLWCDDGSSLFDHFGPHFTLLVTGASRNASAGFVESAEKRGIPLQVMHRDEPAISRKYGSDLILIRPDQHVAWRGNVTTRTDEVFGHALGNANLNES